MSASYDKLMAEMKEEFPKFRIVEKKDSFLMKVINVFLKVITFGKMRTFMTRFITTVLYTVYVPPNWDDTDRVGVLKHERVHMRQMRKYGVIWFAFSYLFLWTPAVFARFRRVYEQEAYEESMRHDAADHGIESIEEPAYRNHTINHFTSAQYFWTWPFRKSIEKWYDSTAQRIRLEMGLPLKDNKQQEHNNGG